MTPSLNPHTRLNRRDFSATDVRIGSNSPAVYLPQPSTSPLVPVATRGRGLGGIRGLQGVTSSLHQRVDTDDDQSMQFSSALVKKHLNQPKVLRRKITSKLSIETWLWEKEQTHRLFNFHDGCRKLENPGGGYQIDIVGSHVIKKNGRNDVSFV